MSGPKPLMIVLKSFQGHLCRRAGTGPGLSTYEPLLGDTLTAIPLDGHGALNNGIPCGFPRRSGVVSGARSVVGGGEPGKLPDLLEVSR